MKLQDCELVIGVVIDPYDPQKLGRVKASVPGWFNNDEMKIDEIPWIYPFTMGGTNSYSCPSKGKKIWVLHNKTNYMEYWYIPFFEMHPYTQNTINQQYNDEVIFERDDSSQEMRMFFNELEGFNIEKGKSKISLKHNGDVLVTGGNGMKGLHICDNKVQLGDKTKQYEAALCGERTQEALQHLATGLSNLAGAVKLSTFTANLAPILEGMASDLAEDVDDILARNTFVN